MVQRWQRNGLVVAVVAAVGCDEGASTPSAPRYTVQVRELDVPEGTFDFSVDLRVVGEHGFGFHSDDLSTRWHGDRRGSLAYVSTCGAGSNRVELAVDTVTPGTRTLPPDLVVPAASAVGVTCSDNDDTPLDYRVELARASSHGGVTGIALADLRCFVARACGDAGDGEVRVACQRLGGDRKAQLGVRDARVACGERVHALPVAGARASDGIGMSATPLETSRVVGWSTRVSDAEGCTLRAELVAAPALPGDRAPGCTAWPVIDVALPLGEACEASTGVSVRYEDAGGPAVDEVLRTIGSAPAPAEGRTCAAAPSFEPPGDVEPAGYGFLDLALDVALPARATNDGHALSRHAHDRYATERVGPPPRRGG